MTSVAVAAPAAHVEADPVRAVNARIAQAYDTVIYDSGADPRLDPSRTFGAAAIYGQVKRPVDVLDLGCGGGAQLESLGDVLPGRLVGVDISVQACERARARLERFGDRAEIICADVLDLDEARLGQFDLVHHIGVLYLTPPAVQQRLLQLVGRSLKPGGVAVVSYYAGLVPSVRAMLFRTLRAAMAASSTPSEAVRVARANLKQLEAGLEGPYADLVRGTIELSQTLPDVVFFHEALNQQFEPLQTSTVQTTLAQQGVNFVGYLTIPAAAAPGASPLARAVCADRFDLVGGGYRLAVFVKDAASASRPDVRAPGVAWSTHLTRTTGDGRGPTTFVDSRSNLTVTLRGATLCAFAEATTNRPLTWNEGLAAARVVTRGPVPGDEAELADSIRELWRLGLATPLVAVG